MITQQMAVKPVQEQPVQFDKKFKRKKLKDREENYTGLCSTCRHSSTCIFTGDTTRPVSECNEFEVIEIPDPNPTEEIKEPINAIPDRRYQGLCMNCENRSSCMFASTEGGVWHCEEYR